MLFLHTAAKWWNFCYGTAAGDGQWLSLQTLVVMDTWLLNDRPTCNTVFTKKVLLKVLVKVWHTFGVHLLILVLPILFFMKVYVLVLTILLKSIVNNTEKDWLFKVYDVLGSLVGIELFRFFNDDAQSQHHVAYGQIQRLRFAMLRKPRLLRQLPHELAALSIQRAPKIPSFLRLSLSVYPPSLWLSYKGLPSLYSPETVANNEKRKKNTQTQIIYKISDQTSVTSHTVESIRIKLSLHCANCSLGLLKLNINWH